MGQLAGAYPVLQEWSQQLRMQSCSCEEIGTLAAGWVALRTVFGVPDYPMEVETSADVFTTGMKLYSACPYEGFVQKGMQLTGLWLSWSHVTCPDFSDHLNLG